MIEITTPEKQELLTDVSELKPYVSEFEEDLIFIDGRAYLEHHKALLLQEEINLIKLL